MSGGVSRLKHVAGRQGNYAPCLKVPKNVKVIELLKEADTKKAI